MAYDKDFIFKEAIKAAENPSAMFIQDVIAELPCATSTFYEFFPSGSEEMETIKHTIWKNQTKAKRALRLDWFKNGNSATQLALYKLIASDDERRSLSMQYIQGEVAIDEVGHLTVEERNNRINKIMQNAANRGNTE